jgi:hypothetical protein
LGKAAAAGILFGDELGNKIQTQEDSTLFGSVPKSAEISLEDSGLTLTASARVRNQFDVSVDADAVLSNFPPVWGGAGLDNPFVTPIVPIPGVAGQASLTVTAGDLGNDAVNISGNGS